MVYVAEVSYQNWQFKINKQFNLIGRLTQDNARVKTVTAPGTGSSARCLFLLRVILTDEEIPPLIIFEGMPCGSVARG